MGAHFYIAKKKYKTANNKIHNKMLLCQRWTPLNDNNNSSTTAAKTGSSTSWVWPNLILNSNTNTNSNSKLNLNPRRMQMTIKSKLIDCHLSLSHLLLTHRLLKLICRLRPIWVYKEKEKEKNAVKNTKSFCPYTALEFSLIIIGSVTPTPPRGALPPVDVIWNAAQRVLHVISLTTHRRFRVYSFSQITCYVCD